MKTKSTFKHTLNICTETYPTLDQISGNQLNNLILGFTKKVAESSQLPKPGIHSVFFIKKLFTRKAKVC